MKEKDEQNSVRKDWQRGKCEKDGGKGKKVNSDKKTESKQWVNESKKD